MFPRISVECWGFPAILSWIHSLSRRQRERTGLPYWIWCCRYITWFCHRIDDWGRIGNPVYDIKSTGRWQCKEIFCKCDFVYPHNQHSICPVWHFSPDTVMHMMGADAGITQLGRTYTRIFLLFTPFFMMNYVFSAFVRNDNAPTLAMIGTMMGSFSNVVLDYVFMFPMGMGLAGAALATAASPIVSILICSIHFVRRKIRYSLQRPDHRYGCLQHPASWGFRHLWENFLPEWQQRFLITWF